MPRPKARSDIENIMLEFCRQMKKPTTDIFSDFEFILSYQLRRFHGYLFDETVKSLKNHIQAAGRLKKEIQHLNRIYLITDVDCLQLMLVDVEDCILHHIETVCNLVGTQDPMETHPKYCNTIFIFSDAEDASCYPFVIDLGTKTYVELIQCFHTENNLSNAVIRDSWYRAPRQEERSRQRHRKP